MCLDPVSQTLYVFGGRVVHPDKNVSHYSGLFSYNIPTDTWRLLRADGTPSPKQDGTTALRSRIGHSMLYDETLRGLVIFAGQMNKDYLSDFYVYDIAADRVIEVCKDYNKQGGPEAGFTQRAAISSKEREIYVLSGLVKDRALGVQTSRQESNGRHSRCSVCIGKRQQIWVDWIAEEYYESRTITFGPARCR